MSTVRWVLHDPKTGESWTMPINPDSMTPVPLVDRKMRHSHGRGRDRRVRTMVTAPDKRVLEWGGVIRTSEHYDELVRWARKSNAIVVTDHIGRRFRVFIDAFEPTDRKPTPNVRWRLRYTMRSTLLARL